MKKENFIISLYSENRTGILARITSLFVRRGINIESLTVSESEIPNIHRFTIDVNASKEKVENTVLQVEKQVDVVRAYFHRRHEVIAQEVALYKVDIENFHNNDLQKLIQANQGTIIQIEKEFVVIQRCGTYEETDKLYKDLIPFGIMQFARSGRVAVTKPAMPISHFINKA